MLPNIDPVQVGAATGSGQAAPKRETDRIVNKAYDAYRGATQDAEVAEKGSRVERAESAAAVEKKESPASAYAQRDEAQLSFRVTPEERDSLVTAFSGKESAEKMTKEEKDTLQGASERITKLVEEAAAKSTASRARTEKALSEWYSRLAQGESPSGDLLSLLRQAAMGQFDEMYN